MTSASTCQTQRVDEEKEPKSSNSSKSCFQPTVSLKDWWLIRAERDSQGRTLAVAGLTSREGQALRGFTSAPILKIYDVFNLETIDGICVVLKGFINKSRSEENGFPSEVIGQFLFGFPPQWETFNEKFLGRESKGKASASDALCFEKPSMYSEKVKDLKKLDQNDHVETTGETIQDHNGRKDYEVEDNLMRDNQNDGEVANEVIVQKKKKRATRSSDQLNSTNTSTSIAKEQGILDHNGIKDYEVEDNLMRDSQNDGEVASEVIVQKKTKRAMRSSNKLNFTNTSTSIAKEKTIQDRNGRKDYEVEDNLMRDNQNDGEVASEVIVQKKTKRATRSPDMLNSTNTSTSIAKEQTADVNRTTHFKSSSTENAKRKLSYGSPQQGKEAVRLISPEPLSFNRSRSGRVLLPPMAFWRNQRAVYDADQRVTEVIQGDPNLDYLSRVCRSEPSKKRRQHR
ncbi:kinetochore-associated protein KNL-2 homolog isoform X6 [Solanum verrucosum]|uniref:kinetochore-associated protein KNL-2 homolog isoform X6 n=1 Tax=Solanum verrucosum TaxID=315347 RepID=UPI0020D02508|nr:kinetochore-associated protein KNL-2 homolog isoform X6 [Solanum verrucosum]